MHIEGLQATRIRTAGADIAVWHGGPADGAPLLLLHGYPQTHAMWHAVVPRLVRRFRIVCPDLRGYGDSSKPGGGPRHEAYAKRAMAADMAEVMRALGHERFAVAGHDRGARVAHRLALDHANRVTRACVMDIAPTLAMFEGTDQAFATGYYHWFFLIQPGGLPERMIGADPGWYLREKLARWSAPGTAFAPEAVADYVRCFSTPDAIHATCEDYRAAAGIDLEHDRADREHGHKLACPLLVLWGARGLVGRTYDVLGVWRGYSADPSRVDGRALDCGHFLPEEVPHDVAAELERFFAPVTG